MKQNLKVITGKQADKFIEEMKNNNPILSKIKLLSVSDTSGNLGIDAFSRYKTRVGTTRYSSNTITGWDETIQVPYAVKYFTRDFHISETDLKVYKKSPKSFLTRLQQVFAEDTANIVIEADTERTGTESKDLMLKTMDGLYKQIDGDHTVSGAADDTIVTRLGAVLTKAAGFVPLKNAVFFVNEADYEAVYDTVDNAKIKTRYNERKGMLYYHTYPVLAEPEMPDDTVLFGNFSPVVMPILGHIELEYERDIHNDGYFGVFRAKADFILAKQWLIKWQITS